MHIRLIHWIALEFSEIQRWCSLIFLLSLSSSMLCWISFFPSFNDASVQFSYSVVSNSLQSMNHSTPGLTGHYQLLEFTQTHVHWVGDAIRPSHPLSSLLILPSIFPSISVFSNESALCIRWPKYWSFSFNISSSNEHAGLISFRKDWLDLLAVQGTLKSLLQN